MKRFSEQLKKKSDSIRMRASERRELRERLVSYMEYHPVAHTATAPKARKGIESITSDPFKTIFINMAYVRSFAGVFALFLVVGVPLIAERSVPGDMLYPVKVQFNEEVRSTLSLSPYAKVEWETQRLERRIAEARLLADEGKLTQEIEAEVAQAVKNHTTAAQKEIATIRESDSDEAAIAEITFASALAVQSEVLEGQVASDEANKTDTEGRSVVALAGAVAEARTSAENTQTNTPPSFDKLLGRVELETTRAYELFASVRVDASPEEIANIERRLADIERKVSQAITLHAEAQMREQEAVVVVEATSTTSEAVPASENTEKASTSEKIQTEISSVDTNKTVIFLLRGALTDTQKLLSFMTDIDVRLNVSIEELVPVTLTDEERFEKVTAKLDEVRALYKKVTLGTYDVDAEAKIVFGMTTLDSLLTSLESAIETQRLDSAETLVSEAYALAKDLETLSQRSIILDGEEGLIIDETTEKSTSTEEVPKDSEIKKVLEVVEEEV